MTVIALDFNPNDGKNRGHKRTCCHDKSNSRTSSVCDILPCKKRFRVLNRREQCCSSKFPAWNGYDKESDNSSNNNGNSNAAEEQFRDSSCRCVNSFFLISFFSHKTSPFILLCLLVYFQYWEKRNSNFRKKSETIFFDTIKP